MGSVGRHHAQPRTRLLARFGEYDANGELAHFSPSNTICGRGRIDGRTVVVVGDDFTGVAPPTRPSTISTSDMFAVWADTIYGAEHAARRSLEQIAAFHQFLAKYPDRVELALTGADVRRIVGTDRLAAMLAIEGGLSIQNDLGLLRTYARLGATSMTLTHSASIDWVDSSTDVERCGGLTEFGREVIAELNRLQMIVDLSHVSDKTIDQVTRLSTAPRVRRGPRGMTTGAPDAGPKGVAGARAGRRLPSTEVPSHSGGRYESHPINATRWVHGNLGGRDGGADRPTPDHSWCCR